MLFSLLLLFFLHSFLDALRDFTDVCGALGLGSRQANTLLGERSNDGCADVQVQGGEAGLHISQRLETEGVCGLEFGGHVDTGI